MKLETIYVPATEKLLALLGNTEENFSKRLKELSDMVMAERSVILNNLVRGFLIDKVDTLEGANITLEGENFVVSYPQTENKSQSVEDSVKED